MGKAIIVSGGGSNENLFITPLINQDKMLIWLKGDNFIDESPFARTVTNNSSVILTTDIIGNHNISCMEFPAGLGLTLTAGSIDFTNCTSSYWINTSQNVNYATVYSIGYTSGAGNTFEQRTSISTTGNLGTTGRQGNSSTSIDTNIAIAHISNEWIHYVIVKNNTNIRYYKNGALIYNGSLPYNVGVSTPPNWYIGRCQFVSNGEWFIGKMTDFRLYNYSLDSMEIFNLWLNGPIAIQD